MKLSTMSLIAAAGIAAVATPALAQPLMINEVYINAKGESDGSYEFIELAGPPNMDLSDYAVAVIADTGSRAEIDEFFVFSSDGGFADTLSSDGLFLLSQVPGNYVAGEDAVNTEAFDDISVGGSANNLQNDGSITILLLRKWNASEWERDVPIEFSDDSSMIDCIFQEYQVIDEIAFSGDGEQEYTWDDANELDVTPNTQPDALTRYAVMNSGEDSGTIFQGETEHQKNSYLQWIFGDLYDISGGNREYSYDDPDTMGGPADPEAWMGYTTNGSGNLELTAVPSGLYLTPGDFNEDENGTDFGHDQLSKWDYDWDGDIDCDDRELLVAAVTLSIDLDEFGGGQYVFQDDSAKRYLQMSQADGLSGGTGGGEINTDDLDAFDAANCTLGCNAACSPIMGGDLDLDGVVSNRDLNIAIQGGDSEQIRTVLRNFGDK